MVGAMPELVSLFRCIHCRVRMFEQDCAGHLQRHGWNIHASEVRAHFVKMAKDTFPRPGERDEGLYQVHQRRKAAKAKDDEDEAVVN